MFQYLSKKNFRKIISLFIIVISLSLILIISSQPIYAQSIRGINSEISNLRSRINRLESEVRNLKNVGSDSRNTVNNRTSSPNGVVADRVIGRSDPLTERLATLLIELKEDVRDIETRLEVLENK